MGTTAAIALSIALSGWALAAWDIARKWIGNHSAAALHQRQLEHEDKTNKRLDVHQKAIENLAHELAGEVASLKAQQVGVLSGMSNANQARRFQR
jgi:hypothetical protein